VVEVSLDGERHRFPWPARQKLLDLLLEKGLDAPYSCREGACSACACRLVEGEVKMLNNDVLDSEDIADGIVLACQSVPVTDTVKITYE
jgi:3-ketosteroid 9alpha-monooxygenase subunit B